MVLVVVAMLVVVVAAAAAAAVVVRAQARVYGGVVVLFLLLSLLSLLSLLLLVVVVCLCLGRGSAARRAHALVAGTDNPGTFKWSIEPHTLNPTTRPSSPCNTSTGITATR